MKPFDLEKALAGDPVITRDGMKIIEIKLLEKCIYAYSLVAVLQDGSMEIFTREGYKTCVGPPSNYDLFMAEKSKKKLYMGVGKYITEVNPELENYITTEAYTIKEDLLKVLENTKRDIKRSFEIIEIEIEIEI